MRQTGQFELLSGEVQVFARDLGEVVKETEVCQPPVCRSNRIRSAAAAGVRSKKETTCIDARVHLHITPYRQAGRFRPIRAESERGCFS